MGKQNSLVGERNGRVGKQNGTAGKGNGRVGKQNGTVGSANRYPRTPAQDSILGAPCLHRDARDPQTDAPVPGMTATASPCLGARATTASSAPGSSALAIHRPRDPKRREVE